MARINERQFRELELLLEAAKDDRQTSVEALQDAVDVSSATIYNDIEVLTRMRVLRARGTLQLSTDAADEKSDPERFSLRPIIKRRIASTVVDRLPKGTVLYLDTGSTCFRVAEALIENGRSDISVVTPNPHCLAFCLQSRVIHDVICLGGVLRPEAASLYGSLTESALNQVSFDTAIISVDFVHSDPLGTLATFSEAEVRQKLLAMQRAARSIIIVVDESKLARNIGNPVTNLRTMAGQRSTSIIVGSDGSIDKNIRDEALDKLRQILGTYDSVACVEMEGSSFARSRNIA